MGLIFICYRHHDTQGVARPLAKFLSEEYGRETVFFDDTGAPPGTPWPTRIRAALSVAGAIMVLIGPRWLQDDPDKPGHRRIDDADDWVRQEILTSFHRLDAGDKLFIMPVLVGGAPIPDRNSLDRELGRICDFTAIEIAATGRAEDFVPLQRQLSRYRFQPVRPTLPRTPQAYKVPSQLTEDEEKEFRARYPKWTIIERNKPGEPGDVMRALYRWYDFPDYSVAWEFMQCVHERGIVPFNHHPWWQNFWNRVEFRLCTANIGHKPSAKDVRLAEICEAIWLEFVEKLGWKE